MNRPSLYSRASGMQRRDAKEIAEEYAEILKIDSQGKQSLLDVGSGSGDVLIEIIVPVLAANFTQVTGTDISPKMVEYTRKLYGDVEGVDFKELNIATDQLPLEFREKFDRVTSFYCLHWVNNQRKCLENIFNSLRKNGDCLLVFIQTISILDAYRALARDPRWKKCMQNLEKNIIPFTDHPQIEALYGSLLEEAGFVDRKVEVKQRAFVHDGIVSFKDNMKAINMFPVPDEDYEDYFNAMCDSFTELGLRESIPGTDDYRFTVKYRLIVAYARKGE